MTRASKDDANGIGLLIVVGIIASPFFWAYDKAGWWGVAGLAAAIAAPFVLWLLWPAPSVPLAPAQQWQPGPFNPPSARHHVPGAALADYRGTQRQPALGQSWQTTLNLGLPEIDRLVAAGDWNSARTALQRIAYGMVDADPQTKAQFTSVMSRFAESDPFFADGLKVALSAIEQSPGVRQADLYRDMPDDQKELIRYVLYFAAALGKVVRVKKGNSYALYPAGYLVPEPTIKAKPAKGKKKQ